MRDFCLSVLLGLCLLGCGQQGPLVYAERAPAPADDVPEAQGEDGAP